MADNPALTDDDIQAAARHWLSQPGWRRILTARVDDLLPGDLRAEQAELPERLLESDADDPENRMTREGARRYEAMYALESAGYGSYDTALLDRTADALLSLLRERVDQRMQQVFRPEETASVQPSAVTSSEPGARLVRNGPKLLDHTDDWHAALLTGWGDWKAISRHSANQYQVAVKLFSELVGNKHVGQVTREDAALFRSQLFRLPATLGKGRPVHALKQSLAALRAPLGDQIKEPVLDEPGMYWNLALTRLSLRIPAVRMGLDFEARDAIFRDHVLPGAKTTDFLKSQTRVQGNQG